jgi:hypothetical protein
VTVFIGLSCLLSGLDAVVRFIDLCLFTHAHTHARTHTHTRVCVHKHAQHPPTNLYARHTRQHAYTFLHCSNLTTYHMCQSVRFLCCTCPSNPIIIRHLQVPSLGSEIGFSFIILICPCAWNSLGPAGHFFMKFYIGLFH